MVLILILIFLLINQKGGNGEGIYCYDFNNGFFKFKKIIKEIDPAIIISYQNKFFVIQEKINRNGNINLYKNYNLIITTKFGSKSSCYLDIKDNYLVNINYWDGIIDLFLIHQNNLELLHSVNNNHRKNFRKVINTQDHLNNIQAGSHTHFCKFWKKWIFISDLGDNGISQYVIKDYKLVEEHFFLNFKITVALDIFKLKIIKFI